MSDDSFAIAILGLAIRCPGAPDAETYWRNLAAGVESIEHWDPPADNAGARLVPAGGRLAGADRFDASFFGFSAREAALTDPQQRQFLEVAWEAFESAGIVPGTDRRTGVFAGAGFPTYLVHRLAGDEQARAAGQYRLVIGNDKDHVATRTAYALDLRGPAMTVQTACSTSLVCLHMACQSLLGAECDLALAGASAVSFPQHDGYLYVEDGILSPDGHCRPFDASGRGTVPGSGVAAVLLRRFADAVRDGDPIRAVIRASAINNDGAGKSSYTAPSVAGQAGVIRDALRLASLEPDDISYVEAHGTATALGDTVEIAGLDRAMPRTATDAVCHLGSVKSNLGHLDVASGLAGLVKTVLALEHETIPPTLHFERPNPELRLERTRFRVAAHAVPWPRSPRPRHAGVSSFGLGGTNAHVILEEAPVPAARHDGGAVPLLISAGSTEALEEYARRLATRMEDLPAGSLGGVAATLAFGRRHRPYRRAVVAASPREAAAQLVTPGSADATSPARVAFVFPGAARLSPAAIRELMAFPEFARGYAETSRSCAEAGGRVLGADELLAADEAELERPTAGLPVMFAMEIGLARLWSSWGLTPAVVVGHSTGEYAAAVSAGVMSLPDAAAMVVTRARLLEHAPEGRMVALRVPVERAERLAAEHGLSVAVVNTPADVVLSGAAGPIRELLGHAERAGIDARPVPVATAAHSALLGDAPDRLTAFASTIALHEPSTGYISSMTGRRESELPATAAYWGRHLRDTVQFADAVATTQPLADVLVEVGPGGALAAVLRACPGVEADRVVPTLPHHRDPTPVRTSLLRAASQLWMLGADLTWDGLIDRTEPRLDLPSARFTGEVYTVSGNRRPEPVPDAPSGPRVYERAWTPRPIVAPAGLDRLTGATWIVYDDSSELAAEVTDGLRASGAEVRRVFAQDCPEPPAAGAGDEVRSWLDTALAGATGVCYFWANLPSASRRCAFAFDIPMAITAILGARPDPAVFTAVGRSLFAVLGTEPADPEANLVIGPALVAGREYPQLSTRVVDVAGEHDPHAAGLVLAELTATDTEEVVAVRGRKVWVPHWRDVDAPDLTPDLSGTVLITGGLGGIGLAIAGALSDAGARRIALLGRTGLPPRDQWAAADRDTRTARVIDAVRRLESHGARVIVATADVTRPAELADAVGSIAGELGPVHTVVHAAGIPGGGLIALRTPQECAAVLAPKVDGIRSLAAALAGQPVRQVQICSALDAVLGTFGQVDYVAANAFLDAVPRTGAFGDAAVLSVNWGMWRDVGIAAETGNLGGLAGWRARMLEGAIPPAAGAALAHRLLGSAAQNVAVSAYRVGDLIDQVRSTSLPEVLDLPAANSAGSSHPRPLPPETYVAPQGPLSELVASLWAELLGVAPIGATDSYFALGGDSLTAIRLVSQLREIFPFPIRLTDLLDHLTVAEQARWLADEVERYVETLADEEVERQLGDLSRPGGAPPAERVG